MTGEPGKYRGTKEYLLIYCELINAARHRGTITYQEMAEIMGLPLSGSHMSRQTGTILGEISEDEHSQGRPMLSAVAVGVNGVPGSGFYTLARDIGKLQSKKPEDETAFWEQEKQAVYATWQKSFRKAGD